MEAKVPSWNSELSVAFDLGTSAGLLNLAARELEIDDR